MSVRHKNYNELVSLENAFQAWKEFKKGKSKKPDVMEFERHLEDNLFALYEELVTKRYKHGFYETFKIWDPKFRIINKALVKDRVVHHLVFSDLYDLFDNSFIYHSYSSRNGKGTHLAVKNLAKALRSESGNYKEKVYVLKCDIKKFFDSINHDKLKQLISRKIKDYDYLTLINKIINSFNKTSGNGLPLGNITSQIFANIYLNPLDQFVKRNLSVKYYFRYADDFIIVSKNRGYLLDILNKLAKFLEINLFLKLHPQKIEIRKFCQGVDYLGYIALPHYVALRNKTTNRMLKKIQERQRQLQLREIDEFAFQQSLNSYLGMLKHCAGYKLAIKLNLLKNNSF